MQIDLSGKRAIVTGSTAGIGFAIAAGLAESGATVVINGRSEKSTSAARPVGVAPVVSGTRGVIVTAHFRAPSARFRLTRVVPTGVRWFFCQLMSAVMVLL